MKVVEQYSFFVWQIAATANKEREMSDSWVNACARFLQTWIENWGSDPV